MQLELLKKYLSPGGRYALYPPVSKWSSLDTGEFKNVFIEKLNSQKIIDLYIHIPFCKKLCTFCGCNIRVSSNTSEYENYLNAILDELKMYQINDLQVRNIYFGGGTPNLFPLQLFKDLFKKLENIFSFISFEATYIELDPRIDSLELLTFLKSKKLKRVHAGIQDLSKDVLDNINRKQDLKNYLDIHQFCLNSNIEIFIDLIYGLDFQTKDSFKTTLDIILEHPPTGISLYPLAPVPWLQKTKESISISQCKTLKTSPLKLYLISKEVLEDKYSFYHIGMGHFVNKNSIIFKEYSNKNFHRNQMGIFEGKKLPFLGLGVSSISHIPPFYKQNLKVYDQYTHKTQKGIFPLNKSHQTNEMEQGFSHLLDSIILTKSFSYSKELEDVLEDYIEDKIIFIKDDSFHLSKELGTDFLKTIYQRLEFYYNK